MRPFFIGYRRRRAQSNSSNEQASGWYRRFARCRHRLDDAVSFLLRPESFGFSQGELLFRSLLDLATHRHREPVPVLRRTGAIHRRIMGAKLVTLLAALVTSGRLCPTGNPGLAMDVPAKLHLLWRVARSGADAAVAAFACALGQAPPGATEQYRCRADGG